MHPLVSLIPLSVLAGVGMLWVFKRTSNQTRIQEAKKKMQAYLLELRLYGDDPRLLFSAQKNLLLANFRYIGLMFKPALILTVPMVLLLIHMDAIYGIEPVGAGRTAVLTVQAAGPLDPAQQPPKLAAPSGILVETPAVRALEAGQFSWRIRVEHAASGGLQFDWNGARWEKTIDAGEGVRYVSHRRTASLADALLYSGENRLDAPGIAWVEIGYPGASIETGSWRLHWLVWFFVISLASAYLLKGWFGVTV
jgi:uncharacterized membrane protein (DUF106 family)